MFFCMIHLIKISTILPIIPISIYHTYSLNGLWWCQSLPDTAGNRSSSLTDDGDKGKQPLAPCKEQATDKYFLNIINRNLPERSELHIILILRGKQRHTEAYYCRLSKLLHELKLWVLVPPHSGWLWCFATTLFPYFPWKCRFYQMTLNHIYTMEKGDMEISTCFQSLQVTLCF